MSGGSASTGAGVDGPRGQPRVGISPVDPQTAEWGRGCFVSGSAEAFGATGAR